MSEIDFSNMKEIFIDDTGENIEIITDKILASEKTQKIDEKDINELMRLCHSIKGASRMLKLGEIAEIFHDLESILKAYKEGRTQYDKFFADLFLEGMDEIRDALEQMRQDINTTDFSSLEIFSQKLKIMVSISENAAESEVSVPEPEEEPAQQFQSDNSEPSIDNDIMDILNAVSAPSPSQQKDVSGKIPEKPIQKSVEQISSSAVKPVIEKPQPKQAPEGIIQTNEIDMSEPEETFTYESIEEDILSDFAEESFELVELLSNDFIEVESDPSPQVIDKIFRAMHTLKGSAGFVGLIKFQTLAHTAENLLDDVRNGKYEITSDIINELLKTNDIFNLILNMLRNRQNISVNTGEILGRLKLLKANKGYFGKSSMNTIVNPNLVPDTSAAKQTVSKQQAVQQVKNEQTVSSVPAVQKTDTRAEEIKSGTVQSQSNVPAAANTKEIEESSSAKKKGQQQTQTLRVELSKLDNLMNLVGELVINKIGFSTQLEKITVYIDEIESNLHHINLHLENADLRNSLDMYEKFQEEFMNILNNGDNISRDNLIKSFKELIKTHSLLFGSDNIINKLYENWKTMVVEYQQISSYYLELYKSSIVLASKIGHIAKDLQENVMQTRMLPISNVFNKYKRTVRDLSQKMKKEIHLELEGEETEMDKNIIEKIGDPLTHIIRNSIDHGLEFPDVRVKEGKPRVGTIKLSAYNQGGAVFIEIEDDGKGIDADIICSKAVEKGLITAERAEMMNEQEKLNLLFIPGFSTAEKVTEISGRGVGMDVVRENITKLKGMIDIRTKIGQGTKMTIKLPLTLAILQVLQVREGTDLFAIPSNNIIEIFSTKLKTLEKVKNIYMINNRGKYIPVYYLSDILGLYSEPINPDADTAIIIVGMGNNNIGLIVSEIVRKEEVVIKNLGDFIKKIRFVSGATIEGDATITLILNISKIIEYISNKGINSGSRTFTSDTETSGVSGTDKTVQSKTKKSGNKRILVVEDSTTTRKMIRSIIESAGYEVIEAVDGIDGLDKLKNAGHFDLATVDVNMPRLNGYGFTQEVRKLEQFAKFPIIMITTRDLNVDKTKGFEAGVDDYIVKPFEPAELINVIRTYIC